MFQLKSGKRTLIVDNATVMGILNVTPDSFSDGGEFAAFDMACKHADHMVAQGAKIIDIGGESTRPGAADVVLDEELNRVLPLIDYVSKNLDVLISIDTSKPEVMEQAIKTGAHLINDVRALQAPGAIEMAALLDVPVCLMHMQGQPRTMQNAPTYKDVVEDIIAFFRLRIAACIEGGIDAKHLILDPGFGFGKTLTDNYELLNRLSEFKVLELPLLIGLSRKSMMGNLLNRQPQQRLAGSLAGAMLAAQGGANILRVHDVPETVDILKVMDATERYQQLSI
ncbi:dihydropteroate synthase [Shewanella sp. UCD-KL12]|uniref:dihydropteroate synthase n=1 Tax=Shewanella sp. UCD-KL12 TaxID=1917163 RepID=UPI000970F298|nr:dihydropteroate synthase [Shewanella sp. UCD-KL12]